MVRIIFVCLVFAGLAACETVEGAGQDIQNAGQAIENESNRAQQ